jgi:hypothetical protein
MDIWTDTANLLLFFTSLEEEEASSVFMAAVATLAEER